MRFYFIHLATYCEACKVLDGVLDSKAMILEFKAIYFGFILELLIPYSFSNYIANLIFLYSDFGADLKLSYTLR